MTDDSKVIGLDTGCVWGNAMTFYELETGRRITCDCNASARLRPTGYIGDMRGSPITIRLHLLGPLLTVGLASLQVVHGQPAPEQPVTPRIINGLPVNISEVPWQVALVDSDVSQDEYAQFCGGSIASENWIVTAAHCLPGLTAGDIEIIAGITTLGEPGSARSAVQQIISHPEYDDATLENDIALLKLASPLNLDSAARSAIALPYAQQGTSWPAANTCATVSGWGNTSTTTLNYPDHLMAAEVDVLTGPTDPQCGSYSTYDYLPELMLCAAEMTLGRDACQGDSGGPLAVDVAGNWTLAGIVSWGFGCADPLYPGVYTRVTRYLGWVENHAPELNPDYEEDIPMGLPIWLLYEASRTN